jgi:hypothetical protein
LAPITRTPAAGTPVRVGSCERTGGLVAVVADVEPGLRVELEVVPPVGVGEGAGLAPVLGAVAGAGA